MGKELGLEYKSVQSPSSRIACCGKKKKKVAELSIVLDIENVVA